MPFIWLSIAHTTQAHVRYRFGVNEFWTWGQFPIWMKLHKYIYKYETGDTHLILRPCALCIRCVRTYVCLRDGAAFCNISIESHTFCCARDFLCFWNVSHNGRHQQKSISFYYSIRFWLAPRSKSRSRT